MSEERGSERGSERGEEQGEEKEEREKRKRRHGLKDDQKRSISKLMANPVSLWS